jgi:hypothetical protein
LGIFRRKVIARPKIEVPDAEWWAALEVIRETRLLRRDVNPSLHRALDEFDRVCEHKPQKKLPV